MASDELYTSAQKRLIAFLLYDPALTAEVTEIVRLEDFEDPSYEILYDAILKLNRDDAEHDVVAVTGQLESEGNLETIGGATQLYQLHQEGRSAAEQTTARVCAKQVRELSAKSKAHELVRLAEELFEVDSGTTAVDGLTRLQSELNEHIYRISDESTVVELSEASDNYDELLAERKATAAENESNASGLQGIPTLIPSLDKYTTGWLPGQMITVAAATSIGKSIFAINCSTAAIQAGKSVMFFSLEMNEDEIMDRIVSSVAGIPLNQLKIGDLSDDERETLESVLGELKTANLTMDVNPKQTVDSIRAKALKQAQSPAGLDFVVIDYLQLIDPTLKTSNRQEAVAAMSRDVKVLAKQLGVPIMVLSQLNRSNDEENEMPTLNRIRESGAIAQDSDTVILLHRNKGDDEEIPPTYVILEKQRNGAAQKKIRCDSHLECSMFREAKSQRDIDWDDPKVREELESDIDELTDDLDEFDDFDEFEEDD